MATAPIILMIRGTEEYSRRKFGQMRRPAAVLSKSGGNKSQICLPPSLPEFVKSSFDGRYIQTSQIHLGRSPQKGTVTSGGCQKKEHHFADYLMRFEMIYSHF